MATEFVPKEQAEMEFLKLTRHMGVSVRVIPLTRGHAALVSRRDYPMVRKFKWHVYINKKSNRKYAVHSLPGHKTLLLHRYILGAPDGLDVDHRNTDGLDCRRRNLRLATRQQNLANSRSKEGSSRFKGVTRANQVRLKSERWHAQITVNYKRIYLGSFTNQEEAARAYDQAAKRHFGSFARLNFPER